MIVAQNLVLNIGDWTELHGICVLKTAPKVPKRKTMLVIILILPKSMKDNDYTIHRLGFIPLIHEFFVATKKTR